MPRWPARMLLLAHVAACLSATGVLQAGAASSNTVVSLTVASATNITTSGCAAGSPSTAFGIVLPGDRRISSGDCSVVFGSSNDTAKLRIAQSDGRGAALWRGTGPGTSLDTNFSGDGKLTATLGTPGIDQSGGVAMQPDGTVLVSGSAANATRDAVVARFDATGSLDTNFGCAVPPCSGRATFNHPNDNLDTAWAMARQQDGRIVAAGASIAGLTNYDFLVYRLLGNGTLDPSFGCSTPPCSGYVTRNESPSNQSDWFFDVAVHTGGRIVGVGGSKNAANTTWESALVRYESNGVIDTGFGTNGVLRQDFSGTGNYNELWGMAIDIDGSIVAVGAIGSGANVGSVIVKVTAAGQLDTNFGCAVPPCSGFRRVPAATLSSANDVTILSSGKLLVAGEVSANSGDSALMRLQTNGVPDTTFDGGGDGVITVTNAAAARDYFNSFVAEPDGRVLVVGSTVAANQDVTVMRVDANGTVDTRVGTNGLLTFGIGTGADRVNAVAAGHDGKVAILTTSTQADDDVGIAIVDGLTIADYSSTTNTWLGASALFGACLRTSSSATPTWSVDANTTCTDVDTDPWYPVPEALGGAGSQIATAASTVTTASVSLRWGMKVPITQSPGTYVAPVSFEVIAP